MRPAHRSRITAQISGLSYACNVWDGGGQTTVILLHGFLDCGLNWQFLVDALGDSDWHIVAPDWRGHGDTEWIGRGGYYHFTDYARDLEQIAEAIRPQPHSGRRPLHGRDGVGSLAR